jgi:general secretion pathway protein L
MNYLIVQMIGNDLLFARLHMKRGALAMDIATRETIGPEQNLPSIIAAAASAPGRESERVILDIPPNRLFMREMELPISDRRKIREILPLELKGDTPFDPEELVFDTLRLDGDKSLAIWCKRLEVAEYIDLMTQNRMEPEIVTASMFSWHHLLSDDGKRGNVAITDGESLAVYRDGTPLYFRALPEGELVRQVTRTLASLEIGRELRVEKVFLHGTAAKAYSDLPEVPPGFSLLPLNRPMAEFFGGEDPAFRDLAGVFAVARGVALEEPVNFRNGGLAYTAGRKKALRRFRISMALAAALLLLLIGETALRYFLIKRDLDSVNSSIGAIYREVFPKRKKPVDEVAELRSEIKRLGGGVTGSGVLPVLRSLAEIKGNDVSGLYEVEIDGDQLRVKGDARSAEAVNGFRSRAAERFTGAEVGEIKSKPDGSVSFVFRGTVRGGV